MHTFVKHLERVEHLVHPVLIVAVDQLNHLVRARKRSLTYRARYQVNGQFKHCITNCYRNQSLLHVLRRVDVLVEVVG